MDLPTKSTENASASPKQVSHPVHDLKGKDPVYEDFTGTTISYLSSVIPLDL